MLTDYERERQQARRIVFYGLIVIIVALVLLATCAQPADAAKRPPCVGVVVRTTEGVEYVRRRDGSACTRPAPVRPQPAAARRGR